MGIKRINGTFYITDAQRGIKITCPASRVGEAGSLLEHAEAFYKEDTQEATARRPRGERKEEEGKGKGKGKAKGDGKKPKKPAEKFRIIAEDGSKMKPGAFVKALLEGAKGNAVPFDSVVEQLAAYSRARKDADKRLSAERSVRQLVRNPRLPFAFVKGNLTFKS